MIALLLASLLATPVPNPVSSDEEVWQAAVRADLAAGYRTYLLRYRTGAHSGEAEARLKVLDPPLLTGAQPKLDQEVPNKVMVQPPRPGVPRPLDPCTRALIANKGGSVFEFREVRRKNRLEELERYVAMREGSVCWQAAVGLLNERLSRAQQLGPIASFGPLTAHPLRRNVVSYQDYPVSALRAGEQGIVGVAFEVAPDGAVENCRVVEPSGSAILGERTCSIITDRMRYDPARNAAGVAIRSSDKARVRWFLGS